jgi:hypothetical protein
MGAGKTSRVLKTNKKLCKRAKGGRRVEWNEKRRRLKAKPRKALEQYEASRKQRSVEVETAFGQIKGSRGRRGSRRAGIILSWTRYKADAPDKPAQIRQIVSAQALSFQKTFIS